VRADHGVIVFDVLDVFDISAGTEVWSHSQSIGTSWGHHPSSPGGEGSVPPDVRRTPGSRSRCPGSFGVCPRRRRGVGTATRDVGDSGAGRQSSVRGRPLPVSPEVRRHSSLASMSPSVALKRRDPSNSTPKSLLAQPSQADGASQKQNRGQRSLGRSKPF
jgi:hypothetical protein